MNRKSVVNNMNTFLEVKNTLNKKGIGFVETNYIRGKEVYLTDIKITFKDGGKDGISSKGRK